MLDRAQKICEMLLVAIPKPEVELINKSNYMFLIAVVLSAQTTDKLVNKVIEKLYDKYKTINEILLLGEEGLAQEIKTIGLYKNKSKNIISLSRILIEQHNGEVPSTFEELIKLPGVGRKTANVVLNALFDKSTIPVDTHVFRVSHRLNLSEGNTPEKVEQDLEKFILEKYKNQISNLLVLHGRYTCTAKKPKCDQCALNTICSSEDKKIF